MQTSVPATATVPTEAELRALIDSHLTQEGPLLPILHDLQDRYGHIPDSAVPLMAAALKLTRAEVQGVISFYHDFRRRPAGHHVIKICRAEACQAMGANALAARLLDRLGLDWNGTTADGQITVEPVYCLGLCACGPAAMVGETLHGRMDDSRLDTLLQEIGA